MRKLEFVSDLGKRVLLLTTKCEYTSFLLSHLPYSDLHWLSFLRLEYIALVQDVFNLFDGVLECITGFFDTDAQLLGNGFIFKTVLQAKLDKALALATQEG